MPNQDGTGPQGKGPETGRGLGPHGGGHQQGGGKGKGPGSGRGRQGGAAAGPEGECICPQCGHSQNHERGVPCEQVMCPKCSVAMRRG